MGFNSTVVRNGIALASTTGNMTSGTAFEEFLKQKPNYVQLGDYYFELLRDATRSLVLNTANSSGFDYLRDICTELEDACIRYAKLYYYTENESKNRALVILRGVVQDLISNYHYNKKYELVDTIFNGMEKLIKV